MTGAIRRFFSENPSKFDPREYLKPARAAAKAICVKRYTEFGTAGNASKIKVIPLQEMARQYAGGKLAQVVQ
jgi:fructose-bisphosphate aldolase class II